MIESEKIHHMMQLMLEASETALRISKTSFQVSEKKEDQGPVTEADYAVNHLVVKQLKTLFPDDLIVSEEQEKTGPSASEAIWFIDPIDGTREFVSGSGDWSIMVGRSVRGVPQVGWVAHPAQNCLYFGKKDQGAFVIALDCLKESPDRLATHLQPIRSNMMTKDSAPVVVKSRSHPSAKIDHLIQQLGARQTFQHGSVGLKICLVAEGRADIYFNLSKKCHAWDVCAAHAILNAAGGEVFLIDDEELSYDDNSQIGASFFAVGNNWRDFVLDRKDKLNDLAKS